MPSISVDLVAGVLVLHGIAHLVGFIAPWRILEMTEVPYKTTVLGGAIDVGDAGIRVVGVLWLIAAIAFAASAMGLLTHALWWRGMALSVTGLSIILTASELPRTKIGLALNVAILLVLLSDARFDWLPTV
ncbi:MAG: ABC transporter permease [Gemmatimonadota bacterium]|nr:ABC transporter permease [Gemmatimonadota bacterium]